MSLEMSQQQMDTVSGEESLEVIGCPLKSIFNGWNYPGKQKIPNQCGHDREGIGDKNVNRDFLEDLP